MADMSEPNPPGGSEREYMVNVALRALEVEPESELGMHVEAVVNGKVKPRDGMVKDAVAAAFRDWVDLVTPSITTGDKERLLAALHIVLDRRRSIASCGLGELRREGLEPPGAKGRS